ncbi:CAP domain-containing protein [Aureibaculum sp. 2210JD6-5]|uniref:CAP domain-containing protein n=1 Tax=Aureibaculum sp. 2210JD6-5 TaxID=3103957 RepID=UPI002AAE7BE3|nr:CAP domain-containing protein [Aureibaculum sp. 2210JD6-5]MDY7393762.1 CAP domain-containing protein [Aureibaculum sp. 2210JD6-5]
MKALLKYSFVLLLFVSISSCSEDDSDNMIVEMSMTDQIFTLVNAHRESNGLEKLTRNTTADNLAIEHSRYMIEQDKISHDNFKSRTENLKRNENAKGTGENVAYGYNTAEKVVNAWLNSSGHKENIEGNFTHTGIAAVQNAEGTYFFTQLFYR